MNKRRKILAAMLAAFMLLVPMVSTAQIDIKGDGGETSDLSGTWGTMQITDYQTEEYVPLGEGLWLLAGAAGLYLLVKSRKTRKATAVAAAALALTLGTTQCKKTEESVIPAGETISISFMAGNGAKSDIDVTTGRITWEAGDKVYVVCNDAEPEDEKSAYSAVLLALNLTAQSGGEQETEISGDVIVPEGYTLPANPSFTFYYVGDGVNFDKTDFTFEISSQDGVNAGHYMVGRTEPVEMKVKEGTYVPREEGAKHFDPLTSVLRLETSEFGANQTLMMNGGNNLMTIDLTNPETPSYTAGSITFTSGEDVRISVVPTTTAGDATLNFSGNGKVGSITVKNGIKAGRIYSKVTNNAGYPIHVDANGSGVLPGKFSVSATEYVQFSKGNLQATYHTATSSYTWAFAANQYDYIGNNPGNTKIKDDGGNNDGAVVDLFGWSTEKTYYGISNSAYDGTIYSGDFRDWATAIDNSGTWCTLSADEWDYLINKRTIQGYTGLTNTCVYATVNGVGGLIIFCDDYDGPIGVGTTLTEIPEDCLFLPSAGTRTRISVDMLGNGYYWSSTDTGSDAKGLFFGSGFAGIQNSNGLYYGRSVRLVQKFEKPDIEPEFVDLGLPSGLKWATCNLGASKPEEYGDYYAWGATTTWYSAGGQTSSPTWKEGYSDGYVWANCPGNGGSSDLNLTAFNTWKDANLTDDVLNSGVDAAAANWGGGWRMPTTADWKELYDNTTKTWFAKGNTEFNGVAGYKFTSTKVGYTDKYIFLPVAGDREGPSLNHVGSDSYYWSSSFCSDHVSNAYVMCIDSDNVEQRSWGRYRGLSVRPVYD